MCPKERPEVPPKESMRMPPTPVPTTPVATVTIPNRGPPVELGIFHTVSAKKNRLKI